MSQEKEDGIGCVGWVVFALVVALAVWAIPFGPMERQQERETCAAILALAPTSRDTLSVITAKPSCKVRAGEEKP